MNTTRMKMDENLTQQPSKPLHDRYINSVNQERNDSETSY